MIAGCKVGPDFVRPKAPTPATWQGTEGNVSFVSTVGGRETAWWQGLGEPALDRIIAQLETQNLTLAEATARIEEARAQRRATMTQRFPTLAVDSSYTYRRFSSNGNAFVPRANSTGGFDLIGEGIDLSWEVDLWGRVKRLEEAAAADIDRSHELFRDLRIVLIAEACRTFLEARVVQHRLLIAEANRDLQRETLELTRMREEAGLTRALDVHQAATQLALTESTIPALEADLRAAVHRLCVLQGFPPVRDPLEIVSIGDIPSVPSMLTVGIPCDLLRQRPDVRAAEDQVRADSARIGVATADLYPQLRVNGSISVDSRTGSQLFTTGSITHDIGPSVRWNIFQFGRVRASIAAAHHRFDQSLARYRQTVLEGYEEVENALVRLETAQRSAAFLETAVREARTAYEAAVIAYKHDNLAFQSVLDTERQLLAAQDEWARARGNVAQAFVELYRAMGGAWEPSGVVAERPTPVQEDSLVDDSIGETLLEEAPLDEAPLTLPEGYESEAAPIEPAPDLVPLEPIENPLQQNLTTSIFERLPPISDDATEAAADEASPLWSTPVDTIPIALPHARTIERFPAVTPPDAIAPETGERTLSNGTPWPPAGGYRFAPAIRAEEPAPNELPSLPQADRYSARHDATAIESERIDAGAERHPRETNGDSIGSFAPAIIAPLPPIDAPGPKDSPAPPSLDDLAPREPFHALSPIRIAPLPLETGHVPADCYRVPIGSGLRSADRPAEENSESTSATSETDESFGGAAADRSLDDEMPALTAPSPLGAPGVIEAAEATDRAVPIAGSADRSLDLGNPAMASGPGNATPQRIEVLDAKPLPASGAGSAVDGTLSGDRSSAVIRLAPAPASPGRASPRPRVGR